MKTVLCCTLCHPQFYTMIFSRVQSWTLNSVYALIYFNYQVYQTWKGNVRVPLFQRANGALLEILWSLCNARNEDHDHAIATAICKPLPDWKWPRNTLPHVSNSYWIGYETFEHWSFLHVEEGILSRTLVIDCGHGCAKDEYAVKRDALNDWLVALNGETSFALGCLSTFLCLCN